MTPLILKTIPIKQCIAAMVYQNSFYYWTSNMQELWFLVKWKKIILHYRLSKNLLPAGLAGRDTFSIIDNKVSKSSRGKLYGNFQKRQVISTCLFPVVYESEGLTLSGQPLTRHLYGRLGGSNSQDIHLPRSVIPGHLQTSFPSIPRISDTHTENRQLLLVVFIRATNSF